MPHINKNMKRKNDTIDADSDTKRKISRLCYESFHHKIEKIGDILENEGLDNKKESIAFDSVIQDMHSTQSFSEKRQSSHKEIQYFKAGVRALLKIIKNSKYIESLMEKQTEDIYKILIEDRRVHSRLTDIERDRIFECMPYMYNSSLHWET